MNANLHFSNKTGAAKLAVPSFGNSAPPPEPEDLDLGFDILVRRYATHRIADAVAAGVANPAFSALIAPPEVTFAAYLEDGSVVLCCPDGLPDSFAGLAERLTPTHAAPSALPTAAMTAARMLTRLDALDRKLDVIQRNHATGDEIVDQLDEIRAALQDGFDREALSQGGAGDPQTGDMPDIIARLDGLAEQIGTFAAPMIGSMDIEQALSESEDRLIAAIRHRSAGTEVAAVVQRIDEHVQGIARVLADLPDVDAMLRRLEDRFDAATTQPAMQADPLVQGQGAVQMLGSMGSVLRRIEAAIDGIVPSGGPEIEQRLASLEGQLRARPEPLQIAEHPQIVDEPRAEPSVLAAPLADAEVEALSVPDALTVPDASPAINVLPMAQDITQDTAPQTHSADVVQPRVTPIASAPHKQGFAQFGAAFAQALARFDAGPQPVDGLPRSAAQILAEMQEAVTAQKSIAANMQDALSQAMLDLLLAQSTAPETPTRHSMPAATLLHSAPFQPRRLNLAEGIAQDIKPRADNVQALAPHKAG